MMKMIVPAVSAVALFAAPASASNFAGPRGEVRVGFEKTTIDLTYVNGATRLAESGHDSGAALGAEIGYDAVIGNALLAGGYVGIEGSTTEDCTPVYGNDRACLHLGRNVTAGGRLGFVAGSSVMVYAKGGYSNGQIRASYQDFAVPANNLRGKSNRGGFHLGAGVEAAINSKSYVRAEYVRTNYNDYRLVEGTESLTVDGHRDQFVMGFGLRF